jgi:hypothetical protein
MVYATAINEWGIAANTAAENVAIPTTAAVNVIIKDMIQE